MIYDMYIKMGNPLAMLLLSPETWLWIFLRIRFKARLWRKQLLHKHVNNCHLNHSKLCRRRKALSITTEDKKSAGGM